MAGLQLARHRRLHHRHAWCRSRCSTCASSARRYLNVEPLVIGEGRRARHRGADRQAVGGRAPTAWSTPSAAIVLYPGAADHRRLRHRHHLRHHRRRRRLRAAAPSRRASISTWRPCTWRRPSCRASRIERAGSTRHRQGHRGAPCSPASIWGYVGLIEGLVRADQGRVRHAHDRHRAPAAWRRSSRRDPGHRPLRRRSSPCGAWLEIHRRNTDEGADMTDPPAHDELVFLPLGGSDEIGMNFNLYGYGRRTTASGSWSTSASPSATRRRPASR